MNSGNLIALCVLPTPFLFPCPFPVQALMLSILQNCSTSFKTRKPSCRWQIRTTQKHAKNCSNSTSLQLCCWQYWSIFIRLAVFASKLCEIPRNSLKMQVYRVRGHPRSMFIDLGVNQKRICNFLLVINSNFKRVSYSFW